MFAVIYAGGIEDDSFYQAVGQNIKSLAGFNNQPCIQIMLAAFLRSSLIEKVAVVGSEKILNYLPNDDRIVFVIEKDNAIDNILAGIEALSLTNSTDHLLVCPGDIPLIRDDLIDEFIQSCTNEYDVHVSLSPREAVILRFPDAKYTYIHLKEGDFSNSSAFIVRVNVLKLLQNQIKALRMSRKSAILLLWKAGIVNIIRYLARQLTISDIKKICCRLFDVKIGFQSDGNPDWTFDIDSAEDYAYLIRNWERLSSHIEAKK